ncbi:MAG: hypothetical protein ACI9G6_002706 [Limisphaerales bacterium]
MTPIFNVDRPLVVCSLLLKAFFAPAAAPL